MKIKKSELIALIKEEIMAEARFDRGMTMMDDPYDDNEPQPASMQRGGAMDQAFAYILEDVEKSLDFPAGALVNYLVTQNPEASPDAVGKMAVQALEVLGMNFPTERAVEQHINREMDEKELERDDDYDDDDMMQEGLEGINPENMQIVMDALQKLLFSPYTGPMIAAAFAAVGVQSVREMFGKRGGDK
jgi:hypothetical protein